MRLAKWIKAPGDRKRYTVDYTDWLDVDEIITDVQAFVPDEVGGVYVDGLIVGEDTKTIIMFVSEGIEGVSYDVGLRITTSGGQIKDDFLTFVVRDVPDVFGV